MKKILMLLMAAVLVLSMAFVLVACDPGEQQGGEETTDGASDVTTDATTENPTTDEVTTDDPGAQEPTDLENAAEYVRQLYKDTTVTAADYTLISNVKVGGIDYKITWTVNTDKITLTVGEDGTVTVDVPDEAAEEIAYVLTATVADAEGNTVAKEFNRTVPKFAVTTWAEYQAAKEGDNLVVQGIVVAINSKAAGNTRNHLFLLDESGYGGYYSYQMDADPVADLGIEVGMTVRVSGPAAPYSGMMEIKGGIATIVNSEIKTFEPVDITDKFVPETNFNELVGMPVIIKGVTLGGQELANATSQYLFFELNGVQSYVRTYVTDFPTTLKADDKATIDAAHAEKFGYTADVTGIMITYSGNPYIIPTSVDCFYNLALPERGDAEKVTFEKDALSFESTIAKGGDITLPLTGVTYPEVSISWASDSELAVVNGDKLTVTIPTQTTTVKLTATVTCGGATETREFEVKILAGSLTYEQIVDAAYGLGVGEALDGTYRLFGVITSVDTAWSDQYGNITVTIQVGDMADKLIQCFRLKGEGAQDLKEGDAITVEGVLKNYNGKIEFDAGCVLVGMGEVISQQAILDIAYGVAQGVVTEETYTLTGVISSVDTAWSDQYKNITVTIIVEGNTEKPIQCFRLKGEGAQGLKVGDTITVTGNFTNYNGKIEFNAGCTLDNLVPGEGGEEEGGDNTETPAPTGNDTLEAPLTVSEALAACADLAQGTASADKFYTKGTVTSIGRGGNYYSEVYFTDGTSTMLIYTLNPMEGMGELKVGDVITVHGFIKNYNGTIEFASNGGEYVYIVALG